MSGGGGDAETDGMLQTGPAGGKALFVMHKNTSFDPVTDIVAEDCNPVQTGGIALDGTQAVRQWRRTCCPSFPIQQDIWLDRMQFTGDDVHGFDVMDAHQVKSEAIHMILLHPVFEGCDHEPAHHRPLTGSLVATGTCIRETAIRPLAVVVSGHQLLKPGSFGEHGMVIHNVHDYPKTVVVKGLDESLEFPDTCKSVRRIGSIGSLRSIIVQRIVSPIILRCIRFGFIHTGIIIGRQQVHMRDPEFLQMIQSRRKPFFVSGTRLR